MAAHTDSTSQHQIHDDDLIYANQATLLAASPTATYLNKVGLATAEGTYWIWSAFGWALLADAIGLTTFSDILVSDFDGAVLTAGGEILTAS